MKSIETDVLVIGAGPSGCVSSSILHKNGFKVIVVEKEKFPRFVIGESLLPRCMEALDEADLLKAVEAKGFQQKFGAKFVRGEQICDFNFSDQFTKGWNHTWQVPRADFDQTLAEEVINKGIDLRFEHAVTHIEFFGSDSVTTIKDAEGELYQIKAKFIVDSSGYGRVIPRLFNLDKPSGQTVRKTMFAHTKDGNRDTFDEPNRIIIVVVEKEVWAWLIPFANGNTSVGFVGDPAFFDKFEGDHESKLRQMINYEAFIKKRFADQPFVFSPRVLEGWSVTTEKFYGDGFVLTGNVTEFLDPIFSSGVTLAVVSGARAANIVASKLRNEPYDWEKDFMEPTMKGVDVFRSYVNGWYDGTLHDIFFTKLDNMEIKNQICSVLAGYVWDEKNPFVKKHKTLLKTLANVIGIEQG